MGFEDEFKYKTYKLYIWITKKKVKIGYCSKLLHKYKTDSKRTWQVMKEILEKNQIPTSKN